MTRYFAPPQERHWPLAAGFRSDSQSVHGSRTIMLADLTTLFDAVPSGGDHGAYRRAIQEDNVLGKKTASTRLWAWKKLRELYALDPEIPVFRLLRTYWDVDPVGRPLLAALAALARDALFRATAPVIAGAKPGDGVSRAQLQAAIVSERGERFSDSTMKSLLANLFSSWTQAGHLTGRREKTRVRAATTTAVTAYALSLAHLAGARGELLFSSFWTSILDASTAVLHDHAREASRLGWLNYRGIGSIVEITFPGLAAQGELLPHE